MSEKKESDEIGRERSGSIIVSDGLTDDQIIQKIRLYESAHRDAEITIGNKLPNPDGNILCTYSIKSKKD